MSTNFFKVRNGINVSVQTSDPSGGTNGDMYYNSSSNKLREFVNGSWRDAVTADDTQTLSNKSLTSTTTKVVDTTDPTKKLAFDTSAATPSTTLTLTESQTTTQSLAIPNVSSGDSVVTNNTTAFLKSKQLAFSSSNDGNTYSSATTLGAFSTGIVRLTGSVVSFAGITAGVSGQELIIENKTGSTFSLLNDNAGASAADRIFTGTGGTIAIANNGTVSLVYDSTSTHWMLVSASSSSGSVVVQTFPSSTTFTVPAGTTSLSFTLGGGGGGGGGGGNAGSAGLAQGGGGGGGGAPGEVKTVELDPVPGDVYTITIGSGGPGGAFNVGLDGFDGATGLPTTIKRTTGGTTGSIVADGGYGGSGGKLAVTGATDGDGGAGGIGFLPFSYTFGTPGGVYGGPQNGFNAQHEIQGAGGGSGGRGGGNNPGNGGNTTGASGGLGGGAGNAGGGGGAGGSNIFGVGGAGGNGAIDLGVANPVAGSNASANTGCGGGGGGGAALGTNSGHAASGGNGGSGFAIVTYTT